MIPFFIGVLTCVGPFFRSRYSLALEIIAFRQQLGVLKRKQPRPQSRIQDRRFSRLTATFARIRHQSGFGDRQPNWIAGPSYGVAMVLLCAFRLGPEERMMLEEFGADYMAYMKRTKRLVPCVW